MRVMLYRKGEFKMGDIACSDGVTIISYDDGRQDVINVNDEISKGNLRHLLMPRRIMKAELQNTGMHHWETLHEKQFNNAMQLNRDFGGLPTSAFEISNETCTHEQGVDVRNTQRRTTNKIEDWKNDTN